MRDLLLKIQSKPAYQIALLLSLFYLSEITTKLTYSFGASFHNYSAVVKGFFMFICIVYSLYKLTKRRQKILKVVLFLSIIFFIGQYFFNDGIGQNFFKNCIFFSRYIFIFILLLFFDFSTKKLNEFTFKTYEIIIIVNSILILLGVIFDIDLFRTYSPKRFGYNGLFLVPSIATYFYALALTYYTHIYLKTGKKIIELVLVSVICFLLGTKAILLFFTLTFLHVLKLKKWYKKKGFITAIILLIALLIYKYKSIYEILKVKFEILYNVYLKYDFITMLTSYRNIRLKEQFLPVIREKWSFINYLFGGTDFEKYRVEFEIFDVFLFFGIIGIVIYLGFYFKSVFKYAQLSNFTKIQFMFLLSIASLSGTFFNNAPVALYLLVVLNSLNFYKRKS